LFSTEIDLKLDLYHSGHLLFSTVGEFSLDDLKVVPKKLIESASVSPGAFYELVNRCYKFSKTHLEAYDNAEKRHEEVFGHRRYANYETYVAAQIQWSKSRDKK
jgi:hypothetical protein